jgi:hypothetical protein
MMSEGELRRVDTNVKEGPFQKEASQIIKTLTSGSPKGWYEGHKQIGWSQRREASYAEYGEDALTNAFPGRGHTGITGFLNALKRAKIFTISDLIARKEEFMGPDRYSRIEGIGPQRTKAARMIISFFERQKA